MSTNEITEIAVVASSPRASTVTDESGAIDVDVTVTLGERSVAGEVTLAPQQFDGRLAAYGTAPDQWISGGLLAEIYAWCGGGPTGDEDGRRRFRRALDLIESAAAAVEIA